MAADKKKIVSDGDKKQSSVNLIVMLVIALILGTAHGFFLGKKNLSIKTQSTDVANLKDDSVKDAIHDDPKKSSSADAKISYIKTLSPIVTNLKDTDKNWIRLEISLIFSEPILPTDDVLAKQITEDILFYIKTLTLKDIEGPVALLFLNQELNERASVRSEGRVKQIIIESFVIQ